MRRITSGSYHTLSNRFTHPNPVDHSEKCRFFLNPVRLFFSRVVLVVVVIIVINNAVTGVVVVVVVVKIYYYNIAIIVINVHVVIIIFSSPYAECARTSDRYK